VAFRPSGSLVAGDFTQSEQLDHQGDLRRCAGLADRSRFFTAASRVSAAVKKHRKTTSQACAGGNWRSVTQSQLAQPTVAQVETGSCWEAICPGGPASAGAIRWPKDAPLPCANDCDKGPDGFCAGVANSRVLEAASLKNSVHRIDAATALSADFATDPAPGGQHHRSFDATSKGSQPLPQGSPATGLGAESAGR